MPMNKARKLTLVAAGVAALATAAVAAAGTNLSLVAYSTPKTVMGKIIQAWQQTPDGKDVSFSQSYGASTDQARAVAPGLNADVVFLSTGDDVNLLVDDGLVDSKWDKQSLQRHRGRHGRRLRRAQRQPEAHQGLGRPRQAGRAGRDAEPVQLRLGASGTSSPPTARSAGLGKTDKQATAYVQKLFQHVVSQDTSGRNATNTFLSGKGDVLITYESEAITSRLAGTGHPVRDPAPDDADRAADRGDQEQRRTRTSRTRSSAS